MMFRIEIRRQVEGYIVTDIRFEMFSDSRWSNIELWALRQYPSSQHAQVMSIARVP